MKTKRDAGKQTKTVQDTACWCCGHDARADKPQGVSCHLLHAPEIKEQG